MRIAIVTNEFPLLSETFISNKVLYLTNRDHHLLVICNEKNGKLFEILFRETKKVKIILMDKTRLLKYLLLHPFQATIYFLFNRKSFKRLLENKFRTYILNYYKPDIVHFEFSAIAVNFLDIFPKLKSRKIVSCRGSAEKVKLFIYEERKKQISKLFSLADAIHCVSDDMRRTILPYCNDHNKIFINYPSIDTQIFKRATPYQPQQGIKILSVGRLAFQKGYLTGLLAVKRLKEANINFQWFIVGSGSKYEELTFHINELHLTKEVILTGIKSTNEIIDLYQQTDIFFLPSVYEGIANAALEAMSMELPVVSTRSGGMQEVITHGVNGFLADVYDDENLGALLLQLINNFNLRKVIGQAARQRIIQCFNIHLQIENFESVYTKLITDRGGRNADWYNSN